MRKDRVQQAASVVRAPNLIMMQSIDARFSRVLLWEDAVHEMIAQDLEDAPELLESEVPPDPDDAIVEWIKSLNAESGDVTRMPTLAEDEAFYADDTKMATKPLEPALR